MLVVGEAKARRAGANGQLNFLEADAQRLPLPDDHFQIVCVAFGLRNITDTDRGLRRRPGCAGPAVAWRCSNSRSRAGSRFGPSTVGTFATCYRASGKHSRNASDAYNYLPDSVGEFPSGEALAERIRGAACTTCDIFR